MIFSTQLFSALYSSGETFFQFASWCKDSGNIARCFEERSVLINFFIKIGDKKKNQMMHVSNFWDVFSFREQFLMRDFKIKKVSYYFSYQKHCCQDAKNYSRELKEGKWEEGQGLSANVVPLTTSVYETQQAFNFRAPQINSTRRGREDGEGATTPVAETMVHF